MRRVMDWIVDILAEAGATVDNIGMVNIYMADLEADYEAMNQVYYGHRPARPRHRRGALR